MKLYTFPRKFLCFPISVLCNCGAFTFASNNATQRGASISVKTDDGYSCCIQTWLNVLRANKNDNFLCTVMWYTSTFESSSGYFPMRVRGFKRGALWPLTNRESMRIITSKTWKRNVFWPRVERHCAHAHTCFEVLQALSFVAKNFPKQSTCCSLFLLSLRSMTNFQKA